MERRPNINPPVDDLLIKYILTPEQRACLKVRVAPSGRKQDLGGYQQMENLMIQMLDAHRETVIGKRYVVELGAVLRERRDHPAAAPARHAAFPAPRAAYKEAPRWRLRKRR